LFASSLYSLISLFRIETQRALKVNGYLSLCLVIRQ
jgi:hypothetical protein